MNKKEISDAISNAFNNLAELSAQIYDYWIAELYDDVGDMIAEEWNGKNLSMMENDVMHLVENTHTHLD